MKIELKKNATPTEIREYLERMAELERQQMVQRREHQRMLAAQDMIIKEQQRQAIEIAQFDERIARLEQKVALAEREIAHYKPFLESLKAQYRVLDNKVWNYENIGLPCAGIKAERDKLYERMYRIETKIMKAEYDRDNARSKM